MTMNDIFSMTGMTLGATGVVAGVYGQSDTLIALSALVLGWGFGLYSSRAGGKGGGK